VDLAEYSIFMATAWLSGLHNMMNQFKNLEARLGIRQESISRWLMQCRHSSSD
jgi:hypothetical protein